MSLIIAFSGKKEAIIGADRRSIGFFGKFSQLEKELYSGRIKTEQDLMRMAGELGAKIQLTDSRDKVWHRGDVLAGEVTEISLTVDRRRRIYLVPGAYLLADINDRKVRIAAKGGAAYAVLGNEITQRLAKERLDRAGGKMNEAVMGAIFAEIAARTPSISSDHRILRMKERPRSPEEAVLKALREDCCKSNMVLCGPQ